MSDRYDTERDRERGNREEWDRGRESHRESGGERRREDYDRDRRPYQQSGYEGRENRPYNEYTSDFGDRGDWGRQGNWGTYGNRPEYGREREWRNEGRSEGNPGDWGRDRGDWGRDRGNWDREERVDWYRGSRTGSWAEGEPGRGTGSLTGAGGYGGGMGGYGSSGGYTGNIGAPVRSMSSYSGGPGSFGGGMGSYGERERGRYSGKGPKGWHRSDDRIREDINERLSDHPDIDASEIEVKVNNGEVTLTGTVDERHVKRMAEDVAQGVSGVQEVHNQLRVQQTTSVSQGSSSGSTQHSGATGQQTGGTKTR